MYRLGQSGGIACIDLMFAGHWELSLLKPGGSLAVMGQAAVQAKLLRILGCLAVTVVTLYSRSCSVRRCWM